MSSPIFSNQYDITDRHFLELQQKWMRYIREKSDEELKEIRYILGKDYYKPALSWLKLFKDASWYKEGLE